MLNAQTNKRTLDRFLKIEGKQMRKRNLREGLQHPVGRMFSWAEFISNECFKIQAAQVISESQGEVQKVRVLP